GAAVPLLGNARGAAAGLAGSGPAYRGDPARTQLLGRGDRRVRCGIDHLERTCGPRCQTLEQDEMSVIEMTVKDGIARIAMNRAEKLNAVTSEMRLLLTDAFETAANQADVRAIVLSGAGRSFCAGTDVNEMKE